MSCTQAEEGNNFENFLSQTEKDKAPMFQVLLLDNDSTNDVAVTESPEVNFSQVKEHLRNGGSVFITSKRPTKKSIMTEQKAQQNFCKSRQKYRFCSSDSI